MKERGNRKKRIGFVVGNKMDKTVVVSVERRVMDPRYKKILRRHKKFKAHDQNNECMIGDKVLIVETRHLSKEKYFRVKSIIEKSKTQNLSKVGKK